MTALPCDSDTAVVAEKQQSADRNGTWEHFLSLSLSLSLHFNGHFPGEPGLAGVY